MRIFQRDRSRFMLALCTFALPLFITLPASAETPKFDISTGILRIPYLNVPGDSSYWVELKDIGNLVFALHAGDVVPTISPLVGTWKVGPNGAPDGGMEIYFIFEQGGKFVYMEGDGELPNGMEGGTYTYDSATGEITMTKAYDHNSDGGLYESSNDTTAVVTGTISGDTLTMTRGSIGVDFLRQ